MLKFYTHILLSTQLGTRYTRSFVRVVCINSRLFKGFNNTISFQTFSALLATIVKNKPRDIINVLKHNEIPPEYKIPDVTVNLNNRYLYLGFLEKARYLNIVTWTNAA